MPDKDNRYIKNLINQTVTDPTENKIFLDNYKAINDIGNYFYTTRSSKFNSKEEVDNLVKLELLINGWYQEARERNLNPAIQRLFESASNTIKLVVNEIEKKPFEPRNASYFARIKQVGEYLMNSSSLLASLFGDSTTDAPSPDVKKKKTKGK